jgi:hypothetical protein
MKARIRINARLNRPMFEIRYITADKRKSIVLFGIAANLYGVYICLYPFLFSITMSRKIKPALLTAEERAEIEKEMKESGEL